MRFRNRCDVRFVSCFVESVASNLWNELADRSVFVIFEHWLMRVWDDVHSCACVFVMILVFVWFVISENSLSSNNALVLIYFCYASLLLARSISLSFCFLFYRWFRHFETCSIVLRDVFNILLSIFRISRISSISWSTCASILFILRHHFHRIAKII